MKATQALATLVAFAALSNVQAAPVYEVTPLPGLEARAINDLGQVVGSRFVGRASYPSIWTPNGAGGYTIRDIGPFPGWTSAYGWVINNVGQIAGTTGTSRTFLWKDDGTPTGSAVDLGDPNPAASTDISPTGINDNGVVIGQAARFTETIEYNGFVWQPTVPNGLNGTFTLLRGAGGPYSPFLFVNGINASGDVVGVDITTEPIRPFLWRSSTGTNYDLGTINGYPNAINDSGQIAYDPSQGPHAFLWTPTTPNGTSGSSVDLGSIPIPPGNFDFTHAAAINAAAAVVGKTGFDPFPQGQEGHAFVWFATDGILDLNLRLNDPYVIANFTDARDINDSGQILVYGSYDPDGSGPNAVLYGSFVLTPVPEPLSTSCWTLLFTLTLHHRRSAKRRS